MQAALQVQLAAAEARERAVTTELQARLDVAEATLRDVQAQQEEASAALVAQQRRQARESWLAGIADQLRQGRLVRVFATWWAACRRGHRLTVAMLTHYAASSRRRMLDGVMRRWVSRRDAAPGAQALTHVREQARSSLQPPREEAAVAVQEPVVPKHESDNNVLQQSHTTELLGATAAAAQTQDAGQHDTPAALWTLTARNPVSAGRRSPQEWREVRMPARVCMRARDDPCRRPLCLVWLDPLPLLAVGGRATGGRRQRRAQSGGGQACGARLEHCLGNCDSEYIRSRRGV